MTINSLCLHLRCYAILGSHYFVSSSALSSSHKHGLTGSRPQIAPVPLPSKMAKTRTMTLPSETAKRKKAARPSPAKVTKVTKPSTSKAAKESASQAAKTAPLRAAKALPFTKPFRAPRASPAKAKPAAPAKSTGQTLEKAKSPSKKAGGGVAAQEVSLDVASPPSLSSDGARFGQPSKSKATSARARSRSPGKSLGKALGPTEAPVQRANTTARVKPSAAGRGRVISATNPMMYPGLDRANPHFETLPGVEEWHRQAAPVFPFGETPLYEAVNSRVIQEALKRGEYSRSDGLWPTADVSSRNAWEGNDACDWMANRSWRRQDRWGRREVPTGLEAAGCDGRGSSGLDVGMIGRVGGDGPARSAPCTALQHLTSMNLHDL